MSENNVDEALAALRDIRVGMKPFLQDVARHANTQITGRAIGTYMQNASNTPRSPDDDGPLRIMQGRLSRSLQGSFQAGGAREGFVKVSLSGGRKLRLEKGSRVPYAAIQEHGGTTHPRVTQKSRKFFWAMYFESGEEKWRAMALTKKQRFTVHIPARPYLEPALDDEEKNIRTYAENRLERLIIGSLDRRLGR